MHADGEQICSLQLYGLILLWLQILNCGWKEVMTAQPTTQPTAQPQATTDTFFFNKERFHFLYLILL